MTSPGKRWRLPLLWLSSWRHARQHPWQSWLSVAGIALGVMMVVAVDLANSSAGRAFDLSIATVSGTITHQISGGDAGVPDAIFTGLRTELGLRRSAPTLTAGVRVADTQLTLLGLDLFSEATLARQRPGLDSSGAAPLTGSWTALLQADAAVLQAATAARLGLAIGEQFTLASVRGSRLLTLAATLPEQGVSGNDDVVFTDIATAQAVLGRRGTLDSIDLVLTDADAERVRQWLPVNLALVEAESRTASLRQMTSAFHTNLLAMSLLALLVAALLIYNTVSLSVLQRQQAFGVLRSLGVTGGELLVLVLVEVALLAAVAGTVGVVLGSALGQLLVKLVTRTIDDLYFSLTVTRFLFDPWALVKGWSWGMGVSLIAGALPAWQAAQSRPVTLQQAMHTTHSLRQLLLMAAAGVLAVGAGYMLLAWQQGGLVMGFIALTFIVFGACFTVPLVLFAILTLLLRLAGKHLRLPLRLGLRNLQQALQRPALAVAALAVAVSVTVGVGVMTGSFRDTVVVWLEQSLRGDVLVGRQDGGALAPQLIDELRRQNGVAAVELQYRVLVESSVGAISVMAEDSALETHLYIKQIAAADLVGANNGEGVLVSEPLAWQAGLTIGDTLELYTRDGRRNVSVLGIFHDYTTTGGLVALSQPLFMQLWPGSEPVRAMLETADEVDAAQLATTLRQQLTNQSERHTVVANADIRRITLTIFDRTFAITHVLRLLAILVAFVGILSALLTLQLQRLREYALLRATGMTGSETALVIAGQTLFLGLLAGLLALPLGLVMADVLIDVINQRSFGWSMQHTLPPSVLIQAVLLAVGAALLAGWYPMKRVAAVLPAAGMQQ